MLGLLVLLLALVLVVVFLLVVLIVLVVLLAVVVLRVLIMMAMSILVATRLGMVEYFVFGIERSVQMLSIIRLLTCYNLLLECVILPGIYAALAQGCKIERVLTNQRTKWGTKPIQHLAFRPGMRFFFLKRLEETIIRLNQPTEGHEHVLHFSTSAMKGASHQTGH